MMRLLLALLVLACTPSDLAATRAASCESAEDPAAVEVEIAAALAAGGYTSRALLVERDLDGRQYAAQVGTVPTRWVSSSMAKPVAVAVILREVQLGHLTLRSRPADVLPGYAANAESNEQVVELWQLLNFTSGLTSGPNCALEEDWTAYEDCVEALPLANPNREPGVSFAYSTRQLDIAGLMAVHAAGAADWQALLDAWRASTELFGGAYYSPSLIASAGLELYVTLAEYEAFLAALDACAFLTQPWCAQMQSDQIARNAAPASSVPYALLGRDWHFGFGMWLETTAPLWSGRERRIASYGVAGQYAVHDREHGYRLVITQPYGQPGDNRAAGMQLGITLAPILARWSVATGTGDGGS